MSTASLQDHNKVGSHTSLGPDTRSRSQDELRSAAEEGLTGEPLLGDNLAEILEPGQAHDFPLTKIVCTLGSSSRDQGTVCEMLRAGMSVARLDLSSGSTEFHQETLENLRAAINKTKKMCAVMLDTRGPELQVSLSGQEQETIHVDVGQMVTLGMDLSRPATSEYFPIDCEQLTSLAKSGDEVFIGQYLFTGFEESSLYLEVTEVKSKEVVCKANNAAKLGGSLLTVHVRGFEEALESVTEQDMHDIVSFAIPNGIEFVSLSYTSSAGDVAKVRRLLKNNNADWMRIVAKVEGRAALQRLESIADSSDGIVVSRGNIGLELTPEKGFLSQKYAIRVCNQLGKPCIVSRVVDTLVEAPSPTRAEATDVANAVLDGSDAILLGAETLRGQFPVSSVSTVLSICSEAEKVFNAQHFFQRNVQLSQSTGVDGMDPVEALASSAVRSAAKIAAELIIVFTRSGSEADMVAKYKPPQPVLCVVVPEITRDSVQWRIKGEKPARQSLLSRGLFPLLANFNTIDQEGAHNKIEAGDKSFSSLTMALNHARDRGMASHGGQVVVCQKVHDDVTVKIVEVD